MWKMLPSIQKPVQNHVFSKFTFCMRKMYHKERKTKENQ